ncbi:sugar transferase, PEP-CTERM system associated/exopolysaccharide biosynthesis polyprenyl glycosylphosphotransferase [Granulicella pectinivorans]|uniref:Sugar transferase, PEP-CTERM system associated/exopolysaccharide biosynthesis polyprenyl glycosylphosphotransferase n=1 Tax=Granulicella pectinivorans TaxID=474950 RepID=A0A1I6MME4_9BACT|nr:sugar transferase [Granulicella pectinivorans]SFS16824.1 sugar transferase, PEP-CTERM system associated/exopolysaccharide biosynthesis polyprenyl glycosylphosphotransferase [Granulicella pectinivorans]
MFRFLNVYYPKRTVSLFVCEAFLVAGCFLIATLALLGPDTYIAIMYESGGAKIASITALSLILSYYFDLYEPQIVSGRTEIYFRILLVLGFDCFILALVIFLYPAVMISQWVYALGFALLTPVLIVWRNAYDWLLSHRQFRERVYVLGAGEQAHNIVATIRSRSDIGMEVVGWSGAELNKEERKETWIQDLDRLSKGKHALQRIIVAVEDGRGELPVQELLMLRFQGIAVEGVGELNEKLSGKIQLDGLRPSNFLYSEGFRIRASQQMMRNIVSTVAASVGLLLFLPVFPIVALLVKCTSGGPLFFRQTRIGIGGKTFQVIKFRSMFTDAESCGAKWATKNDPRVTRFGMFMRKTRLDEIPQLWNVVRGDMNFVGPRPERPEFVPWLEEQLPFYYLRHLIRPGLTGWAQVRYGYGATLEETKEKLQHDLYYLKHMSLGLDLLIMFETIKTIVRRRGAQ